MNQRVTENNNAFQDSILDAKNVTINPLEKSAEIKVTKPQILTIPETPKRFNKALKPSKPITEPKIFTSTPDDSIAFNLKVRKESENIFNQTLVNDYLNPIPLSDRVWLIKDIESYSNSEIAIAISELNTEKDSGNIKQDSIFASGSSDDNYASNSIKSTADISTSDSIDNTNDQYQTRDSVKTHVEVPILIKTNDSKNINKDILSGLLLLAVAVTGFLRVTNYKYLRELFSALIFNQNARKMQKTVNLHNRTPAIILNGLFLLNTSIFLYQITNYYQIITIFNQSLFLIPLFMALIIFYGTIKVALYRFVAFVFETTTETKEYLFFNYLHNKVFAIAILPIIIVIPYIEPNVLPLLFKIGGFIFISLYFIQLFRGFTIILKNLASLLYLFLYLCALEILPIVIIYKILIK